jgi:tetratricopeptide (TPR) repeat protein
VRGVLASLEYQLSELREEQQRQAQQWQRRIEDIRQAMDQSLAHEHGRRLAWAVALGLVFTVATASLGLLWYRGQTGGETGQEVRHEGRVSARPYDAREADYRELLAQAEAAVRQGQWSEAERALEQALRLRPEAREAQLALAALRGPRSWSRPVLGEMGSSGESAAPGLRCQLRDGRLCCASGNEPEQCVAWTQTEAQSAAAAPPTPTVRPRQRAARPTMPSSGATEAYGDIF